MVKSPRTLDLGGGAVEQATCAVVEIGDRCVTLALSAEQLAARREGDLITAEIISIDTIHRESA